MPEEGIRGRKSGRPGEILSSACNIVINVYGKQEGRSPEGIDSGVRWVAGANGSLHSREELREHISKHAEQ